MKILLLLFLGTIMQAQTVEKGMASYYNESYHGRKTANGEIYDQNKLSAAHKTLPFGTKVEVYNPKNRRSVIVTINDRGPFVKGRIIELSLKAAQEINMIEDGVVSVELSVIKSKKKIIQADDSQDKIPKIISDAQEMEPGGLYKMQVLKMEKSGFGVQVAAYSDYQSVVQQLAVFQQNWFKGCLVFVDEIDKKPYYKLILGPFLNKEEALSYCSSIKKKYDIKDAFVVNIQNLGS